MARDILTDEMVEVEIAKLLASEEVKLAKMESRIKNRRRQYLYVLRNKAKRGKALIESGITCENIEEKLFGGKCDDLETEK